MKHCLTAKFQLFLFILPLVIEICGKPKKITKKGGGPPEFFENKKSHFRHWHCPYFDKIPALDGHSLSRYDKKCLKSVQKCTKNDRFSIKNAKYQNFPNRFLKSNKKALNIFHFSTTGQNFGLEYRLIKLLQLKMSHKWPILYHKCFFFHQKW